MAYYLYFWYFFFVFGHLSHYTLIDIISFVLPMKTYTCIIIGNAFLLKKKSL